MLHSLNTRTSATPFAVWSSLGPDSASFLTFHGFLPLALSRNKTWHYPGCATWNAFEFRKWKYPYLYICKQLSSADHSVISFCHLIFFLLDMLFEIGKRRKKRRGGGNGKRERKTLLFLLGSLFCNLWIHLSGCWYQHYKNFNSPDVSFHQLRNMSPCSKHYKRRIL